jgi:hypothetical protein
MTRRIGLWLVFAGLSTCVGCAFSWHLAKDGESADCESKSDSFWSKIWAADPVIAPMNDGRDWTGVPADLDLRHGKGQ